jgi:hypothetical protein
MMTEKSSKRPRSEPEIIPPGKQPYSGVWVSQAAGGSHRIYVTRLGPFGIILLAVAIGAIFTLILVLLLGFFLIWILPLIVTLFVIAVVVAFARRLFTGNK